MILGTKSFITAFPACARGKMSHQPWVCLTLCQFHPTDCGCTSLWSLQLAFLLPMDTQYSHHGESFLPGHSLCTSFQAPIGSQRQEHSSFNMSSACPGLRKTLCQTGVHSSPLRSGNHFVPLSGWQTVSPLDTTHSLMARRRELIRVWRACFCASQRGTPPLGVCFFLGLSMRITPWSQPHPECHL